MEEFMIDQDGQVYIPTTLNMAGEDVLVTFQLVQTNEFQEHTVVIGRNPLQGMLIDPSYPEDDFDDDSGFFFYEGFDED